MTTKPTYAILDDLSGVQRTDDGFGAFMTEEEAVRRQIVLLNNRKVELAEHVRLARQKLNRILHRSTRP